MPGNRTTGAFGVDTEGCTTSDDDAEQYSEEPTCHRVFSSDPLRDACTQKSAQNLPQCAGDCPRCAAVFASTGRLGQERRERGYAMLRQDNHGWAAAYCGLKLASILFSCR